MGIKHTALLESLQAPLKMRMQSWGSVREADGTVFLVLWQDQMKKIDGSMYARTTFANKLTNDSRAGSKERLHHIAMIQKGAPCFVISAIPKDRNVHPRTVKDCRDDAVYVGREIIDHEGEWWIKLPELKPIAEAMPKQTA